MKVAFVNTEFLPVPPRKGGAVEEWIERMARGLNGHEVFILSYDPQRVYESRQDGDIRYFWFKPDTIAKIFLSTYRLPFKQEDSKWFYFPYALWCARHLQKIGADIIHIHNRPQFVWIIRRLNPRAKIILHFHQLSAIIENASWARQLPHQVDLFLGCSRFMAGEIQKRHLQTNGKTAVIYNGVDVKKFSSNGQYLEGRDSLRRKFNVTTQRVILYAGRLAENKGAHLLVGAVRNLVQAGQRDIKLFVCGSRGYSNQEMTPYIQNLYKLAEDIKDHVVFAGFVEHKNIPDYYAIADVVVIPSEVEEGFCVITIEALASGVPVLASGRGGIPEIIKNNETGFFFGFRSG